MEQPPPSAAAGTLELPDEIKQRWQRMCDNLGRMAHVPVALIMRVDHPDIEVFIASHGQQNPFTPGDRESLPGSGHYCAEVVRRKQSLHVHDAYQEQEWMHNPDLELGLNAYLGFPICLPDGEVFGTLCILDSQANAFTDQIKKLMLTYKDLLESELKNLMLHRELKDVLDSP